MLQMDTTPNLKGTFKATKQKFSNNLDNQETKANIEA